MTLRQFAGLGALLSLVMPGMAMAEEAAAPVLNSGDTAWMLTATALVLFMTIPGLALFYGGMVRSKNVLSVMMQCFAITGLISILWMVYGYSLAFDTTGMEEGVVNFNSFEVDQSRQEEARSEQHASTSDDPSSGSSVCQQTTQNHGNRANCGIDGKG